LASAHTHTHTFQRHVSASFFMPCTHTSTPARTTAAPPAHTQARVGRPAHAWSFADVADGCLTEEGDGTGGGGPFHLCMCSYALHVLDDSRLFSTLLGVRRRGGCVGWGVG
jgi:hypothetical protein